MNNKTCCKRLFLHRKPNGLKAIPSNGHSIALYHYPLARSLYLPALRCFGAVILPFCYNINYFIAKT
ncbi:hypothetical protein B6N25_14525 [Sphingobacteriales bacterium TSM_CSS]|nr:hypothetical protein B6N25_14525 [Sphingobacteriales bacterium TSM_CSS]